MLNIIFNFLKSFLAVPFDAVHMYVTATNTGRYEQVKSLQVILSFKKLTLGQRKKLGRKWDSGYLHRHEWHNLDMESRPFKAIQQKIPSFVSVKKPNPLLQPHERSAAVDPGTGPCRLASCSRADGSWLCNAGTNAARLVWLIRR